MKKSIAMGNACMLNTALLCVLPGLGLPMPPYTFRHGIKCSLVYACCISYTAFTVAERIVCIHYVTRL